MIPILVKEEMLRIPASTCVRASTSAGVEPTPDGTNGMVRSRAKS